MKEELKDMVIKCKDCGKDFVHSVRDQEFYKKMKFEQLPVRCKDCRNKKKNGR
jgi:ribosomal protein S27E